MTEKIIFVMEGRDMDNSKSQNAEYAHAPTHRPRQESSEPTFAHAPTHRPEQEATRETPPSKASQEKRAPLRMQPPVRETDPAPLHRESTSSKDSDVESVAGLPVAPDLTEEEQAKREKEQVEKVRQEKMIGHLKERTEEGDRKGFGLIFEEAGLEEELQKSEVQKLLQDYAILRDEMKKPKEEQDQAKLQAARDSLRGAPKHIKDAFRSGLRINDVPEDQVIDLLPASLAAPTEEEGGEGHGITAPTEDEQRSEEERIAAVMPFVQNAEERIRDGNLIGGEDDLKGLMKFLKETDWKKVGKKSALYGWRTTYITVLVIVLAYVALMAKTNSLAGKK